MLANSMKLSHAHGVTQDGWVTVERSDRMWSTGEGNGKPLQYSCLENPMTSLPLGFFRQEHWSGFLFPSPVDHVLSELSTMTHPSWVALRGKAHSFIELDKAVIHVISLVSFLWLWFSFCLPFDALSQCLPSYLVFSYLGCGVSLHGCSSKAQLLLRTLDME